MKNVFNDMEEQEREFFEKGPGEEIRRNILNTLGTIRFLGSIADVYLNRMVDTVINMAGARGPQEQDDQRTSGSQPPKDTGYPNL